MRKKDQIVITGVGPLTAGGCGKTDVWDAIINKRTGLIQKEYKIDQDCIGKFYVHKIRNFNINEFNFNQQTLDEIKDWKAGDEIVDLYYFLATVKMALDDSNTEINDDNKSSIGLILAHENIGLDHFYWKIVNEMSQIIEVASDKGSKKKKFFDKFYDKFQQTGYELQTFMSLFHVARMFDLHGFSLFLNNACASGLYALEVAADVIRRGRCEQMIVAAVDRSSIFKHIWFNNINVYAKDGRIKPFASNRDGFIIGDGGTALVLETLENALSRKAQIYAEYLGGGFNLEGWKVTYPDIVNRFYERAIREALDMSKIKASKVDLIVPHGVGTNITDKYEAKAINEVFGSKKKPIVSAFKPYIGHTLGSTALLETAIMLIAMKNRKIPPTLNCEIPDEKLNLNLLTIANSEDDVKIALKTACGFAGYNAACVFSLL